MPSQFRQVGATNARQTNAAVSRWLRRAQRRTETILNRASLPPLTTLLNALQGLQEALQQAHTYLPASPDIARLLMVVEELHSTVEHSSFFGSQPTRTVHHTLRGFYRDLEMLLRSLGRPGTRNQRDSEIELRFHAFLETAAQRGWKVPEALPTQPVQEDGIAQSCDYVHAISKPPENILQPHTEIGLTAAPILLLNEQPIPEQVLIEWTQPPFSLDVFIVFGYYVVVPNCQFLGVRPQLARIEGNDGQSGININSFVDAAHRLDVEGKTNSRNLIRYPRRVQHHYYCPVLDLNPRYRHYFSRWDMLIQQSNGVKHGNAENRTGAAVN